MGSVSLKIGDGTARFRRATLCSSAVHLLMLASVLTTNLFALYAFTSHPPSFHLHHGTTTADISNALSDHIAAILREIAASERQLHQISLSLSGLNASSLDPTSPSLPPELRLYLSRHPLPLGKDSRSGITHMVSSVAHSCSLSLPLLTQFTSYRPSLPCPLADSHLPAKLLLRGCAPLPRRRCHTRPRSSHLPSAPPLDKLLWVKPRGKNDFLIDDVLALAVGGVRIGFDISGGDGSFAARMAERNVTVVTSTVENGEVVAARGVFPVMVSPAERFPFYDGIFDLVHTVNGLDEGGVEVMMGGGGVEKRTAALEFLMFDIDRVLRAGGLFWIDNYLCVDDERKRTVTRVIERFGYKKLKWVVGEKADPKGTGKLQVYLSAVLQKPARG